MANQISSWILTGSDQFQAVLSGTSWILSGTGRILSGTDRNWSEPVGIRLVPLGTARYLWGTEKYCCKSKLTITYRIKKAGQPYLIINLHHHFKHVHYVDVSVPPEAMQMIEEQVVWLTPSTMVSKVRAAYPEVSGAQVYNAWREHSKTHWRRDDLQLPSAKKLLTEFGDEVDLFELANVPEGVEILAWGMKELAVPLKGRVFEIGMDATCEYKY